MALRIESLASREILNKGGEGEEEGEGKEEGEEERRGERTQYMQA
jgi:hypothetical protein